VDMLLKPAGDPGQIALGNIGIHVSQILLHNLQNLGTVGTAQSIGGEVTYRAAAPVAVLKAAFPVIGYFNAKVFFI
jgi:hypothetical protein